MVRAGAGGEVRRGGAELGALLAEAADNAGLERRAEGLGRTAARGGDARVRFGLLGARLGELGVEHRELLLGNRASVRRGEQLVFRAVMGDCALEIGRSSCRERVVQYVYI